MIVETFGYTPGRHHRSPFYTSFLTEEYLAKCVITSPRCRTVRQNEDRIYKRRTTFTILFLTKKLCKYNAVHVSQILTNKYLSIVKITAYRH